MKTTMQALFNLAYGPNGNYEWKEIEVPQPKTGEVLVRICSVGINDYDWVHCCGKPLLYRPIFGFFKPRNPIAGMEFSGVVEAIGEGISTVHIGDEVFADCSDSNFGAFAEFICVRATSLTIKPPFLTHAQASALPHASLLAWQAIEQLEIAPNSSVLINGAGGGFGHFAVQICKALGCEVLGVDSRKKFDSLLAIGCSEVIDYQEVNITHLERKFDYILDCRTQKNTWDYLRILASKGKYITVGGDPLKMLQIFFLNPIVKGITRKQLHILSLKPNAGIEVVLRKIEQENLQFTIDGPHPKKSLVEQIIRYGHARHTGKIVVDMCS